MLKMKTLLVLVSFLTIVSCSKKASEEETIALNISRILKEEQQIESLTNDNMKLQIMHRIQAKGKSELTDVYISDLSKIDSIEKVKINGEFYLKMLIANTCYFANQERAFLCATINEM